MAASGKRLRLNLPARDELRDPLLSVLTIILIGLMFVIVPLHAAGTVSVEGYGLVILLLLASCVLMQSTNWIVIVVLIVGIGLALAAHALRATTAAQSNLDLVLDAIAWIIIDVALIFVIAGAVFAPGRITYHRVNGAVLLYLTIGLTFVGLYTLVGLS